MSDLFVPLFLDPFSGQPLHFYKADRGLSWCWSSHEILPDIFYYYCLLSEKRSINDDRGCQKVENDFDGVKILKVLEIKTVESSFSRKRGEIGRNQDGSEQKPLYLQISDEVKSANRKPVWWRLILRRLVIKEGLMVQLHKKTLFARDISEETCLLGCVLRNSSRETAI